MVRTIRLSIAAMFLWMAFLQPAFADAFTEKVAELMRKAAPDLQIVTNDQNELQIQDSRGPYRIFLDNVRAACVANKSACNAELANYVDRTLSLFRARNDEKTIATERIFLVLRGAGFARNLGEQMPNDKDSQPISRPFLDGIEILYVLDTPQAIRFMNQGDLKDAGLTPDKLNQIASKNAANLATGEFRQLTNTAGIFLMPFDDGLGTARVFNRALWDRIEKEHGPVVVCAPTRDWLLFVKQDNRSGIDQLRAVVDRVVRGEPYAVSSVLFRRQKDGWVVHN